MLADEHPEMEFLGPQSRGGATSSLLLYVPNVDEVFSKALAAGARELRPLVDQFLWGSIRHHRGPVWACLVNRHPY